MVKMMSSVDIIFPNQLFEDSITGIHITASGSVSGSLVVVNHFVLGRTHKISCFSTRSEFNDVDVEDG